MASPIAVRVAYFVFGRFRKSRGIARLFWLAVMVVGGLLAFGGVDGFKQKLKEYAAEAGLPDLKIPNVLGEGPIRVYFTKPGTPPDDPNNPAKVLAGLIDQTKQTIDVAAFEIDNVVITDALVRARQRGVVVRLVTDSDYIHESGVQALTAAGVPVVDDRRDALMHNKFMILDEKAVWTGSMNFTENCAYKNNNNGIYIENAELAANYGAKFRQMFEQREFGMPGRNSTYKKPYPVIKLADGTEIETYFSPEDRIADKVVNLVGEAKTSIHFLAFSFTHPGIGKAMLDKGKAGVSVAGVFEKTQTSGARSEFGRLSAAGFPVYLDANPRNMHHKVIIIDGVTTLTGSFNFSENADRNNNENALIIRNNTSVGKSYEEEYQRVYDAAEGLSKR